MEKREFPFIPVCCVWRVYVLHLLQIAKLTSHNWLTCNYTTETRKITSTLILHYKTYCKVALNKASMHEKSRYKRNNISIIYNWETCFLPIPLFLEKYHSYLPISVVVFFVSVISSVIPPIIVRVAAPTCSTTTTSSTAVRKKYKVLQVIFFIKLNHSKTIFSVANQTLKTKPLNNLTIKHLNTCQTNNP